MNLISLGISAAIALLQVGAVNSDSHLAASPLIQCSLNGFAISAGKASVSAGSTQTPCWGEDVQPTCTFRWTAYSVQGQMAPPDCPNCWEFGAENGLSFSWTSNVGPQEVVPEITFNIRLDAWLQVRCSQSCIWKIVGSNSAVVSGALLPPGDYQFDAQGPTALQEGFSGSLGFAYYQFLQPGAHACRSDLFEDDAVNGADLAILLTQWGSSGPGVVSDINRDHSVDGLDLAQLLAAWGPCP